MKLSNIGEFEEEEYWELPSKPNPEREGQPIEVPEEEPAGVPA